MQPTRWILVVFLLMALITDAGAQQSPYTPLLQRSVLAPPADGDWEGVLRSARIDTTTPALSYVALNHTDYWTRVSALQVLGARASEPLALNTLLQVLDGSDGRLSTWAGEILVNRGLERNRVAGAMRNLVRSAADAARNEMPALTRTTVITRQQQMEIIQARERVVNGLWATRVLILQKDASGYSFLVTAAHITNQSAYIPAEVLLVVVRDYLDAGLSYGNDLVVPIRTLADNTSQVAPIRQIAAQLADQFEKGLQR